MRTYARPDRARARALGLMVHLHGLCDLAMACSRPAAGMHLSRACAIASALHAHAAARAGGAL